MRCKKKTVLDLKKNKKEDQRKGTQKMKENIKNGLPVIELIKTKQ